MLPRTIEFRGHTLKIDEDCNPEFERGYHLIMIEGIIKKRWLVGQLIKLLDSDSKIDNLGIYNSIIIGQHDGCRTDYYQHPHTMCLVRTTQYQECMLCTCNKE